MRCLKRRWERDCREPMRDRLVFRAVR
jgi:hypothetical protein